MGKGQVSIFVIVGIILVLVIGLYISLVWDSQPELGIDEAIPDEFLSVRQYVNSCIHLIGTDGLVLAGAQGGYVNPGKFDIYGSAQAPTDERGLKLFSSSLTVPYWSHLLSDNSCERDCEIVSEKPVLEGDFPQSIESQLNSYMEENFYTCIDDFSGIEGFEVSVQELPEFSTVFHDDNTQFYVEMPVEITNGERTITISQFESRIDVPFRRMYEYASVLAYTQHEYRYLEGMTLELISFYGRVDANALPPFFAISYDYANSVFWVSEVVKSQLQQLLTVFIPAISAGNAPNAQIRTTTGNTAVDSFYERLTLPVNDPNGRFSDFLVSYEYVNWPIYFNMNDDAGFIGPDSFVDNAFSFFGIHRFKNFYDISYPVQVVVVDEDALNGEGYELLFGLEANIRDNSILTSSYNRISNTLTDTQTYVCDLNQRNSGDVSFEVIDGMTGEAVNDVSMTLSCGDSVCPIGSADGSFSGAFPICAGGTLVLKTQDYTSISEQITTNLDTELDLGTYEMFSAKNMTVELRLQNYDLQLTPGTDQTSVGRWVLGSSSQPVIDNERAFITFTRIQENPYEEKYIRVISSQNMTIETSFWVELLPGKYEVEGLVISSETIEIPDRKIDGGLFSSDKTIEGINITQAIVGNYDFGKKFPPLTITVDTLKDSNHITLIGTGADFYNVPPTIKILYEDLEIMDKLKEVRSTASFSYVEKNN